MELLRVSRSISKAVTVIIIVAVFGCLYKVQNEEVTVTNNYEYAIGYNSKMQSSLKNAEQILKRSLYSDKNTFFYRNTVKYVRDIQRIADIEVRPANTIAIEKLMEYNFVPIMFVLIMLIISMQYLVENQNGIKKIVRVAAKGRLQLSLKRTGIMALISVVVSVAVNFIVFGIMLIFYGGALNLLSPIQSSPIFSLFPYRINILQFFYLYCLFFAVAMFVVGQLVYLIMQLTNMNKIAYVVILFVFVLEYILYLVIPASSAWCILKYINLTYVIMPGLALMYVNWGNNYFVTDISNSTSLIMLVLIVALGTINVLLYVYKYETREYKFFEKIQRIFQHILASFNSMFLELYKVLILQFGIIIILFFAILISDVKIMRGMDYGTYNFYTNEFYEKYSGVEPNEQTDSYIEGLKLRRMELMSVGTGREELMLRELQKAISNIEAQSEYLKRVNGKFVNPVVYSDIFGERLYNNQININLLCIVAVILSVAGIFAYERKRGMISMFNTYVNRKKVMLNKAIVTGVVILIICGIASAINWTNILSIYTLPNPEVPIQSLYQFENFKLPLSISGYIVFCQLFRLLILLAIGFLVFIISVFFDYAGSIAISLTLLVPHILYVLRFEEAKMLSPVFLMDYTRINYEVNSNPFINIIYFVLCTLIILEICLVRKRKITV